MRTWQRPAWFPATTVPDVLSRRAWNTLHVMTIEQSEKLKLAFETAADEHGYVSWVTCMQIAKQLGLEYEQVPCPALHVCDNRKLTYLPCPASLPCFVLSCPALRGALLL